MNDIWKQLPNDIVNKIIYEYHQHPVATIMKKYIYEHPYKFYYIPAISWQTKRPIDNWFHTGGIWEWWEWCECNNRMENDNKQSRHCYHHKEHRIDAITSAINEWAEDSWVAKWNEMEHKDYWWFKRNYEMGLREYAFFKENHDTITCVDGNPYDWYHWYSERYYDDTMFPSLEEAEKYR